MATSLSVHARNCGPRVFPGVKSFNRSEKVDNCNKNESENSLIAKQGHLVGVLIKCNFHEAGLGEKNGLQASSY